MINSHKSQKTFSCQSIYHTRTTLYNIAIKSPKIFSDFCFNWYFLYLYGKEHELTLDILKIRHDEEVKKMLTECNKLISAIEDFDIIFNLIYPHDKETEILSEYVKNFFQSNSAKYLFVIRNFIK